MVPPPNAPRQPLIEEGVAPWPGCPRCWLAFTVAGCRHRSVSSSARSIVSATLYALISFRRHGLLVMKDRLATLVVWTGALTALGALVAVIGFVVFKGRAGGLRRLSPFPRRRTSPRQEERAGDRRWAREPPSWER